MKIRPAKVRTDPRKFSGGRSWLSEWRENRRAYYILLTCGHYTERESIQFFSAWQPKRGIYWCEVDKVWTRPAQIQHPILPESPEF